MQVAVTLLQTSCWAQKLGGVDECEECKGAVHVDGVKSAFALRCGLGNVRLPAFEVGVPRQRFKISLWLQLCRMSPETWRQSFPTPLFPSPWTEFYSALSTITCLCSLEQLPCRPHSLLRLMAGPRNSSLDFSYACHVGPFGVVDEGGNFHEC